MVLIKAPFSCWVRTVFAQPVRMASCSKLFALHPFHLKKWKQEKINYCREKYVLDHLEEIKSFLTYDESYA